MAKMDIIYKEYYSHEDCECYKIDMPWSQYRKDTRVLCKVSEGYSFACTVAMGEIVKHFINCIKVGD